MPSNKSSSPILSRKNPNSRTPEFNNPIRRSFNTATSNNNSPLFNNKSLIISSSLSFDSGTATPLNSPSDFGRRRSIDRNEVSMIFIEEKENVKEKGFKPAKPRSQALLNGSRKSFMAPTISAASKFINAHSPRSKILAERNDSVRASSVSFSDENCLSDLSKDSDSKMEKIDDADLISKSPRTEEVSNFNALTNETESLESSVTDKDHNHIDNELLSARFKISPSPPRPCYSSPCPLSAPLDADPHPPPYDPKTNYLSPRPQFLHYRPHPPIRACINNESFTFEGYSDTETSEETTISDDSLKESEDASSMESLVEESDEQDLGVYEAELTDTLGAHLPENIVESKGGVVRKHFLERRSKSISLLLILTITCLSVIVTDTPMIGSPMFKQNPCEVPEFVKENFKGLASKFVYVSASSYSLLTELIGPCPVFKDQSYLKRSPYEIAEFVKEVFDGLGRKIRFWSANYYMSFLTKPMHMPTEVHEVSVKFCNLTDVRDDPFIDRYSMVDVNSKLEQEIYDQNEFAFEISSVEGKCLIEYESEEATVGVSESQENLDVKEQEVGLQQNAVLEPQQQIDAIFETDVAEDNDELAETEELFIQGNSSIHIQNSKESEDPFSDPNLKVSEVQDQQIVVEEHSALEATQQDTGIISETERIEAEITRTDEYLIVEAKSIKTEGTSNNNWPLIVIALLTTLSLVSVGVFYAKQPTPEKKSSNEKITGKQDMRNGDSEMSSSFSSSSKNNRKSKRSLNRESIGTYSLDFSTDSPSSYGSFTTYEKIQLKPGEEEIKTPVRRSSRIRSHQITSPVIN